MSAYTLRTGVIVMATSVALFGNVAVATAQQPTSLVQLLNTIPNSPTTIDAAAKLIDWTGPGTFTGEVGTVAGLAALRADVKAHETLVGQLVGTANEKIMTRMTGKTPQQQAEGVEKMAAAAGIDFARMQTDKAYAKEMQAKLKAMSPAEVMALSMGMNQAMGMGRGSVAVYDPPNIKAAAEAGKAVTAEQWTAIQDAHRQRWDAVASKVTAIEAKYAPKYPKGVRGCDGEGGGSKECQAAWAQYIAAMMPLLRARDTEILTLQTAAFEEERAALAADVRKADALLVAADYGATSQEVGNPLAIGGLDSVAANQILMLAGEFERLLKKSAYVAHCGEKWLLNTCFQ